MDVQNVMTRDVVTVSPETPLRDVARLLVEHRISGVPVCDEGGNLLGVVSEADIVRREEGYAAAPHGPLAWLLDRGDGDPRVEATTAGEAMSAPAVTVHPTCPVAQAARLMTDRGVNRLPVVLHERLIGIVTRADLVRAFIRSDEEIQREINADVLLRTLWITPDRVDVVVTDGHVEIAGRVETRSEAEMIVAYVRRVPGVLDVDAARLEWSDDDLARRTMAVPTGADL